GELGPLWRRSVVARLRGPPQACERWAFSRGGRGEGWPACAQRSRSPAPAPGTPRSAPRWSRRIPGSCSACRPCLHPALGDLFGKRPDPVILVPRAETSLTATQVRGGGG